MASVVIGVIVVIVVLVVLVVLGGHDGEYVMEHGILFIVPLYDGVIGGAWWWDCRRHGSDKAGPPNMLDVAHITNAPHAAGDMIACDACRKPIFNFGNGPAFVGWRQRAPTARNLGSWPTRCCLTPQ